MHTVGSLAALQSFQVVQRLEDIAVARLEAEQAAEAEAAAARAAAEAEAAAAAEAEQARAAEAAAQQQAATDAAEASAAAAEAAEACAAAAAAQAGPVCKLRTGGLARALSQQARDAAAGGAAADMAAAQQQLQHILQQQQHPEASTAAAAAAGAAPAGPGPAGAAGAPHHRYEVLIENDDDPITAEAVAHTLEQFEASSLSKVLSGHPYAVQAASRAAQATANGAAGSHPAAAAAVRALHHSATAPVHSHLLDTAAEAAVTEAMAGPSGRVKSSAVPGAAPISITGAVSRANIELLPAPGPGLVAHGTLPPSSPPAAAAAAAAAAGSSAAGAVGGLPGSSSVPSGGWFLASGSSFKKGMWLEKAPVGSLPTDLRLPAAVAGPSGSPSQQQQQQPASPVPSSPLSLGAAVAVPDAGTPPHRSSFSLQLRREAQQLPTVAEDDLHGVWQLGAAEGDQPGAATTAAAAAATGEAAAARALRRNQTTRRMSADVLAAAGALSKALSAFSSASQALPGVAAAAAEGAPGAQGGAAAAGGGGGVVGSNILLTQDFVAAARGLSEALAALLPSAAALADADPGQGAAAAAAATEAVQGLKSLQGRMASARAAERRSSDGIPMQSSVTEATGAAAAAAANAPGAAGSMGPPAPVSAAIAAVKQQTAFANQQELAFSPPGGLTDAPIRTAALPVAISGPRRSFDGGSSAAWRHQLSWTSRPRAISSSGVGGPADAAMAPASFDSFTGTMSLPRRFSLDDGRAALVAALRQHSPQDQQLAAPTAAAAGGEAGGAVGAAGDGADGAQPAAAAAAFGSSWSESDPVLLRMPSRRRSLEGGQPGR